MAAARTALMVTPEIRDALDSLRVYPRETYADIIVRLIEHERRDEAGEVRRAG